MSTINNGGPAFPVSTGNPDEPHQNGHSTAQFPGMTLRDYFAAHSDIPLEMAYEHALARLGEEGTYLGDVPVKEVLKSRAILKMAEADAMIEARDA